LGRTLRVPAFVPSPRLASPPLTPNPLAPTTNPKKVPAADVDLNSKPRLAQPTILAPCDPFTGKCEEAPEPAVVGADGAPGSCQVGGAAAKAPAAGGAAQSAAGGARLAAAAAAAAVAAAAALAL
jgi:hypothetical protein